MEEIEAPHPDYMKGFNEGYILAKYMPELSQQLAPSLSGSQRSSGFIAGREQYVVEEKENRYPSWLRSDRLDNFNEKNIEKDKDLDEPER
jgi:hypothetical protein